MPPLWVEKEIERALGRRARGEAELILSSLIFTVVEMTGDAGAAALSACADVWECDAAQLLALADRVAGRTIRRA